MATAGLDQQSAKTSHAAAGNEKSDDGQKADDDAKNEKSPAADPSAAVSASEPSPQAVWSGPLIVDQFAQSARWFVLGVGLVFVMLLSRSASGNLTAELMGSLLLIMSGLMIVSLAGDLILLFLGLELVSIPTYVLLYLGPRDSQAQEAATKYFFLSLLSSALLLYGFSFLYGVTGSTRLLDIHHELGSEPENAEGLITLSRLAMVLIFAGLGFRLALVPFHFYAPDVYQGTSHGNAAFLAVIPKIAGVAALVRIVIVPMTGEGSYLKVLSEVGWQLCVVLAIVTMSLGNLVALWQKNVRRMLAYSSVAHAGYMLIGLAVAFSVAGGSREGTTINGTGATLFYLLVYALATAGAFAGLSYLSEGTKSLETIDDIAGLGRVYPVTAAAMAVCLFSLTGLPPLAGFWGKFLLIGSALSVGDGTLWMWFAALSVITVINAAISAGYYLRLVAAMYFSEPQAASPRHGGLGAGFALVVCTLGVLVAGCFPGPWMDAAQRASNAAQVSFVRRADVTPAAVPAATPAAVPARGAAQRAVAGLHAPAAAGR